MTLSIKTTNGKEEFTFITYRKAFDKGVALKQRLK